jgi:CheY-like chemotaxis protein
MRVLVVEDERRLAGLLARGLTEAGHDTDLRYTGPDGLLAATTGRYDAVVLDVMLPGLDGVAVCQQLRRTGHTVPVLMLTARDAVPDRVAGLDAGADDYLGKPFSFDELLARLRALHRRTADATARVLQAGDLRLDPSQRRVSRGGTDVAMHPPRHRDHNHRRAPRGTAADQHGGYRPMTVRAPATTTAPTANPTRPDPTRFGPRIAARRDVLRDAGAAMRFRRHIAETIAYGGGDAASLELLHRFMIDITVPAEIRLPMARIYAFRGDAVGRHTLHEIARNTSAAMAYRTAALDSALRLGGHGVRDLLRCILANANDEPGMRVRAMGELKTDPADDDIRLVIDVGLDRQAHVELRTSAGLMLAETGVVGGLHILDALHRSRRTRWAAAAVRRRQSALNP